MNEASDAWAVGAVPMTRSPQQGAADMGPAVEAVIPSPTMPADADVVIIGGGIVGTSAALHLARKGVKVVLCEKGHIAGEQSSRNWGWVRRNEPAAHAQANDG